MKLIHITDTHLVAPGLKLYGLDPRARLDAAIADINKHHAYAEVAVVTGDLTHWGEVEAYRNFLHSMRALQVPYVVLVGNHDRRAACLGELSAAPRDGNGFVQGWRDTPRGRLLFLDTLDEASRGRPALRAAPRLACACAAGDAGTGRSISSCIIRRSRSACTRWTALPWRSGRPSPRRSSRTATVSAICSLAMCTGRSREAGWVFRSRPCAAPIIKCGSICRRTAAPRHEPPAYAVVLIGEETVVVHTHDYLDQSPRFPFGKPRVDDRTYMSGLSKPSALRRRLARTDGNFQTISAG